MTKRLAFIAVVVAVVASACGGAQRPRTDPASYKCRYNSNERCDITIQ
jgi:hypothetical protein